MAEEQRCCPKFDPESWDEKTVVWKDKRFIKDKVFCLWHVPVNMGQVITRMWNKVQIVKGEVDKKDWILLSDDVTPWTSVQYMAVDKKISGAENITLSGTFLAKVFEGRYKEAPKWLKQMEIYVKKIGKHAKKIYFYYTTCPKCAQKYGKNYVVLMAEV